jgi:oligopeptide/dipeptide ABC transporter ATP-binding protein
VAPVIEIRNLRVFYRTKRGYIRAVDDVSLEVVEGESFGLVGESGCGKTTLGKAVLGILPPGTYVRGEILYRMPEAERREMQGLEERLKADFPDLQPDGPDVLDSTAVRSAMERARAMDGGLASYDYLSRLLELKSRYDITTFPPEVMRRIRGEKVVLIFQDPMSRLDPLMSVRDHFVELIKAHHNVSEEEAERRAVEALSSVGIPPTRLKNYPHEFSGGMRQRIMIAMALVMNPELLIADEPTTSLDVLVEAQILQLVERLREAYRMAMFLITHNLGIVAETCERVGVMYAGKLVEVAEVNELFSRPRHPYTDGLLSSVIHLETKELRSIDGLPPDLLNPPSGCRFHPRCPHVMDVCRKVVPPMVEDGSARVACFLYGGEDA